MGHFSHLKRGTHKKLKKGTYDNEDEVFAKPKKGHPPNLVKSAFILKRGIYVKRRGSEKGALIRRKKCIYLN